MPRKTNKELLYQYQANGSLYCHDISHVPSSSTSICIHVSKASNESKLYILIKETFLFQMLANSIWLNNLLLFWLCIFFLLGSTTTLFSHVRIHVFTYGHDSIDEGGPGLLAVASPAKKIDLMSHFTFKFVIYVTIACLVTFFYY